MLKLAITPKLAKNIPIPAYTKFELSKVKIMPTIATSKFTMVKVFLPKQSPNNTKNNIPKNTPLKLAVITQLSS